MAKPTIAALYEANTASADHINEVKRRMDRDMTNQLLDDIKADREAGMNPEYGDWRWSGGRDDLMLSTTGNGRMFVMGFCRKGMKSAQPMFQTLGQGMIKAIDKLTTYAVGDGTARGQSEADADTSVYRMDIAGVDHPDARRIARTPELEAAYIAACERIEALEYSIDDYIEKIEQLRNRPRLVT